MMELTPSKWRDILGLMMKDGIEDEMAVEGGVGGVDRATTDGLHRLMLAQPLNGLRQMAFRVVGFRDDPTSRRLDTPSIVRESCV